MNSNELYLFKLGEEEKEKELIKGDHLERMDICWVDEDEIVWFKDVKLKREGKEEDATEVWSLNVKTKDEYKVGTLPFT